MGQRIDRRIRNELEIGEPTIFKYRRPFKRRLAPLEVIRLVETRIAPRHRVTKPAVIEDCGNNIACTIRDLSLTGARLDVSDPIGIPATFTLIVPEDGLKLSCHVVWRSGFRIAVAFD